MECLKSMALGVMLGAVAGMVIGACKSSMIFNFIKQGKKEVHRFKRKYM